GCERNRRDRRECNSTGKQQAKLETVATRDLTRREADGLQHSELAPPPHDALYLQAGRPERDKCNQKSDEKRSARADLALFAKCRLEVVTLRQPETKRPWRRPFAVFCQPSLFQQRFHCCHDGRYVTDRVRSY